MKRNFTIWATIAGMLVLVLATQVQAARYYTTMEQPQGVSEQIKAATDFSVMPIDYSAIDPKELGYPNVEEWNADKQEVPKAYAESFPALLKEANIINKKVTMVSKTDKISRGIVVDVAVTKIVQNWNAWTARPDEYICKITFTNAATGQKLYAGVVNINSLSGNPYAQGWGNSFSRRMQSAAFNMAWVLTKIMAEGRLEPAEY